MLRTFPLPPAAGSVRFSDSEWTTKLYKKDG